MSPSDPAAAWTTRGRHKVQFAYSVNHLVDLLNGVIVDVAATPTRISMEVDVVETMLDRVEARFDLKPERITADVAYGTGGLLGAIVARNIAPHIPVWDKGKRDNGTLSRAEGARTQDPARCQRSRARPCPRPHANRGLPRLCPRAADDRNRLCRPETQPRLDPPAPARAHRRER
jgi:hypothetical protein